MKQQERGRISAFQYMCILLVIRMTATTVAFPFMTGHESPTDAWIGALIGIGGSLVLLELMVRLSLYYPDMTVVQFSQALLGKFFGGIAALLLVGFWVFDAAVTARAMGSALVNAFMPETPVLVFIIVTVFFGANGARQGLEITARWSELATVGVLMTAIMLVLPFKAMSFQNLLPILPYGLSPHLKRAATMTSMFLRLSVLGMMIPYVRNKKDVLRYTRYTVIVSGIVLTAQSIALVAVFGSRAATSAVPTLQLVRQITIGEFFERLELIPVAIWVLITVVNMAVFVWASALGIAQLFNLNRFQPLVYPIGALATLLSILLFKNYLEQVLYFKYLQSVFVPLLVLGVYALLYAGFALRKLGFNRPTGSVTPMGLEAEADENK